MKSNLLKWSKTATAIAVIGLATTVWLTAADPPENNPGRPSRGPGGGQGGGNFQQRLGGVVMNLDDQQRELFREAMQKNSEQLRSLDEKLRAAQKELVKAAIAEQYDEKIVREKAEAVGKIQVEMTALRAKAFSVVVPTLKPEQREQLENSPFGANMLMGGFGGRGAGFGGPGGPGGPGGNPPQGRRAPGGQ